MNATRESILNSIPELRAEVEAYENGDADYRAAEERFINSARGQLQYAEKFAAMSFEEQEAELVAINRMNRKGSAGLVA